MLHNLTAQTFTPYVNSIFRLADEAAPPLEMSLLAVTELGDDSLKQRRRPFSLLFRGPARTVLPQRIYNMEHAEVGVFALFLKPLGPDREGMRYEAIFT